MMASKHLFATLSLLAALAASGVLTFAPVYRSISCTADSNGAESARCISGSSTLVEENGTQVLVFLAIPVAIALLGLVSSVRPVRIPRFLEWTNVIVLLALVLLTGFSIGLLYLPAAILLLIAVLRNDRVNRRGNDSGARQPL